MIQNLPPLSLSYDNHLTALGVRSLEKVSKFLKETVLETSGCDIHGELASELLLGIALQRGSLRYLLEWIEMSLESSCQNFRQGKISRKMLEKALIQMQANEFTVTTFMEEVIIYI